MNEKISLDLLNQVQSEAYINLIVSPPVTFPFPLPLILKILKILSTIILYALSIFFILL